MVLIVASMENPYWTTIKPILVFCNRWWYEKSLEYNKERHGEKKQKVIMVVNGDIVFQ